MEKRNKERFAKNIEKQLAMFQNITDFVKKKSFYQRFQVGKDGIILQ